MLVTQIAAFLSIIYQIMRFVMLNFNWELAWLDARREMRP